MDFDVCFSLDRTLVKGAAKVLREPEGDLQLIIGCCNAESGNIEPLADKMTFSFLAIEKKAPLAPNGNC